MRRIMIAGTGSGCGKTTVTCAILSALQQHGIKAASFKCGPDYIDPMFHREILGASAYNLDSFFCDKTMLRYLLTHGSRGTALSVIEGVMGFYDGADSSAHAISELTETPVILVINCKGMKESIGAVMRGFLQYHLPNRVAGFIFNKLPEHLIPFAQSLCTEQNTEYFGCLPAHSYELESRHLGLVTASEIADIHEKMHALGQLAEQYIHIDKLLHTEESPLPQVDFPLIVPLQEQPVIAVAKDRAFCFIYDENIEILQQFGCKIRYFSPIKDTHLPAANGLYLCGGYPELYAAQLSANETMRTEIRTAISNKMPVIAECGGFLYLHDTLRTKDSESHPMTGVIHAEAYPTDRLQRFGYISMQAAEDNLLCNAGETIRAHEFHYWDSTDAGHAFCAKKTDARIWQCGHVSKTMYAGFPHLYFPSDIRIAERFARACANFGGIHETN